MDPPSVPHLTGNLQIISSLAMLADDYTFANAGADPSTVGSPTTLAAGVR